MGHVHGAVSQIHHRLLTLTMLQSALTAGEQTMFILSTLNTFDTPFQAVRFGNGDRVAANLLTLSMLEGLSKDFVGVNCMSHTLMNAGPRMQYPEAEQFLSLLRHILSGCVQLAASHVCPRRIACVLRSIFLLTVSVVCRLSLKADITWKAMVQAPFIRHTKRWWTQYEQLVQVRMRTRSHTHELHRRNTDIEKERRKKERRMSCTFACTQV